MVSYVRFIRFVAFRGTAVATIANEKPAWVDGAKAARILQVPGRRNIVALAERGEIRTRDLPGVRARFCLPDVERLARVGPTIKP